MAERANISRSTLWAVEKGNPGVTLGTLLQVMFVLGLEKDFLQLAKDDDLGRKLQDINLLPKKRAPRKKGKRIKMANENILVYAHWEEMNYPNINGGNPNQSGKR